MQEPSKGSTLSCQRGNKYETSLSPLLNPMGEEGWKKGVRKHSSLTSNRSLLHLPPIPSFTSVLGTVKEGWRKDCDDVLGSNDPSNRQRKKKRTNGKQNKSTETTKKSRLEKEDERKKKSSSTFWRNLLIALSSGGWTATAAVATAAPRTVF